MEPSNTQINRAGDVLREFWIGERMADAEVEAALALVGSYRQAHAYPLTLVSVGLRQFVRSVSENVVVGQRLKRMDRIVQKLVRFPKMKLARMQDVGGCRAVLASPAEVGATAERIRRNWDVIREKDYRDKPAATGYRALHLIVSRSAPDDEMSRQIEIQLRTKGQHIWAEEVERVAARTQLSIKDGGGPDELLDYYRAASEIIAMVESDQRYAREALLKARRRLERLRQAAVPYLGPTG